MEATSLALFCQFLHLNSNDLGSFTFQNRKFNPETLMLLQTINLLIYCLSSGFYSPPDRGGGSLLRSTLSPFSSAASAASKLWSKEKDKREQRSVTSLMTHMPHGKRLVFVLRPAESRRSSSQKIMSIHTQLGRTNFFFSPVRAASRGTESRLSVIITTLLLLLLLNKCSCSFLDSLKISHENIWEK